MIYWSLQLRIKQVPIKLSLILILRKMYSKLIIRMLTYVKMLIEKNELPNSLLYNFPQKKASSNRLGFRPIHAAHFTTSTFIFMVKYENRLMNGLAKRKGRYFYLELYMLFDRREEFVYSEIHVNKEIKKVKRT